MSLIENRDTSIGTEQKTYKGVNMNKFLAIAALALTLTSGFTCSKNAPQAEAPATTEAAPMEAVPTEAAPMEAVPTEAAPTEVPAAPGQ